MSDSTSPDGPPIGARATSTASGAEIVLRPVVPARSAFAAVSAGLLRAADEDVRVSIAVVDRAGQIVVLVREDDALPATGDLALAKARTAAAFARSSASLRESVLPSNGFFGLADALPWPAATFAGGAPLLSSGYVFGGVGVSGGSGEQDSALARFVASVIDAAGQTCEPRS